ncbi:MAG: outer membrane lipoprotein carrier protein LolA [Desulfuromonadales bacterium]|nr:outer membrane lipoprotein carrier protein LolA [Desulfuromonadales bacterium]
MKNRIFLGLILTLLLPTLAVAANVGLKDVINALEVPFQGAGAGQVRDVRADFFQESRIAALDRSQRGRGTVMFLFEPGDNRRAPVAMFNWQYQEPSEQEIVSDGRTMWVYLPESRQVIESDLTLVNRGGTVNPVTFLSGLGNLSREFSIMYATPNTDSKGNYILELRPKQSSQLIRNLQIVVDRDAVQEQVNPKGRVYFPILSTIVTDPSDNQTIIEFSNVRVNRGLSRADFRFMQPPGVELVKPQPGTNMGF